MKEKDKEVNNELVNENLDEVNISSDNFKSKLSKEEKSKRFKKEAIEWIFCIIIAYIIYLFINYFLGSISGVKQISMSPTAMDGDKLLIQRPVIFEKDVSRGDVVTFIAPDNVINSVEPTEYTLEGDEAVAGYIDKKGIESFMFNFLSIDKTSYIKRVIGVSGDHVVITKDGNVYVNDELLNEPYLNDGTTSLNGCYTDVTVPEGYIYVMGDNRLHSMDSRVLGCIPLDKIDGYVITRIWPLNKVGNLD